MAEKNARIGGVRIDPGVAAWQQDAAINRTALSRKQVADRGRVRIKSDIPEAVKAGIVAQADRLQTSESQVVAFLLAWALHELAEGNGELDEALVQSRRWARALRFLYDLEIPAELLGEA